MRRYTAMEATKKIQTKARIARVFTPSAPIDKSSLFAGRSKEIMKLINASLQRGQHAVLFGERGVGKTSLANVLKDFLKPLGSALLTSTNCESRSTFKSIWSSV